MTLCIALRSYLLIEVVVGSGITERNDTGRLFARRGSSVEEAEWFLALPSSYKEVSFLVCTGTVEFHKTVLSVSVLVYGA